MSLEYPEEYVDAARTLRYGRMKPEPTHEARTLLAVLGGAMLLLLGLLGLAAYSFARTHLATPESPTGAVEAR